MFGDNKQAETISPQELNEFVSLKGVNKVGTAPFGDISEIDICG